MWGRVQNNLIKSSRGAADLLILLTLLAPANPAKASGESNVNSTWEEGVRSAGDGRLGKSGGPHIAQARDGQVLEVQEGEPVLLECTSLGPRPNLELVWRNGKVATENFDIQEDIRMMQDGLTWKTTSIFQFVPLEDQTVVCIAHAEGFLEPQNSPPLQLRLHRNPKVTLTSSNMRLKEGEEGSFLCKTTSSNVTFKWFLNDRRIAGEGGELLRLVDLSREEDGAWLRCLVENSMGRTEASLKLEINFAPKILIHPQSAVVRRGQQVRVSANPKST